ncbi:hypothetical protein AC249_AIPGENE27361 [Exaiptasia diaphana]|nr:hypothetical protein AC249_AIPGENE27361 [Exaiptasia diaphana]
MVLGDDQGLNTNHFISYHTELNQIYSLQEQSADFKMNSKLIVIVLMLVLLTTLHESDAWRRRRAGGLRHLNKNPRMPFAKEDAKEDANNRAYEDEIHKDLMNEMDID